MARKTSAIPPVPKRAKGAYRPIVPVKNSPTSNEGTTSTGAILADRRDLQTMRTSILHPYFNALCGADRFMPNESQRGPCPSARDLFESWLRQAFSAFLGAAFDAEGQPWICTRGGCSGSPAR